MMSMLPLNRSCKQVTALVIAREDRVLPWRERLAVQLHMLICKTCPTFERQVLTMHNAMRQWRNYSESEPPASEK
ncbi:MAG: zf-HC2 domain-containing protein [Rhodoferax sp.]|nr:zf-HC2 domain-containing protein [Rhodoferax sp.]MBP9907318.1 zf-HC2 domain-containing protein [Rhodoferax sp.]